MQSSVEITDPASNFLLMTLADFKIALKVSSSTDDPFLTGIIERASAEVAAYCMRVFAKEGVIETFTEIPDGMVHLYLARWPVLADDIGSVVTAGTTLTDSEYEIDELSGKLSIMSGSWTEPVVVTYAGGYVLPDAAPKALQQAALLLARESYYAAQRGDSTVRMISHKESRVIYFDPNARGGGVAATGSPAQRAAKNLLSRFTRFV